MEGLEETKEKKGVSGDGRITHPVQKHSVSKLSIKYAPFFTHTTLFFFGQVQMHLKKSKQPHKAHSPKCMSV